MSTGFVTSNTRRDQPVPRVTIGELLPRAPPPRQGLKSIDAQKPSAGVP